MNFWLFRPMYDLFMKISEPRLARLLFCGVYLCLGFYGLGILLASPKAYAAVLSEPVVIAFSLFMLCGGIVGAIAILPGIWWLERVGLISLATAMLVYIVVIVTLGISAVGLAIPIAFVLIFALRWLEINWAQLAPKRG